MKSVTVLLGLETALYYNNNIFMQCMNGPLQSLRVATQIAEQGKYEWTGSIHNKFYAVSFCKINYAG